jgi:DNA-binding NarL/FixJ family response regulator
VEDATTVCVVEDHPVLREGLELALRHHGFVVLGTASTAEDGFELLIRRRPQIAVVDMLLGEERGDDLIRLVRGAVPETRIVVFTGAEAPADLERVLTSGADGVVSKAASPVEFRAALRIVARGGTWVDERIRRAIARAPVNGSHALSTREREVLGLIARGMTLDQTAHLLGVASETVRTHARNASRKLNGRSRVHTVALALEQGEIALD